MKCSNCGGKLVTPSKFCPNCGAATYPNDLGPTNEAESEKPKPSRWLGVWLVVIGIALIGTYAAMYIPAFVGQEPTTDPPAGLYAMVWTSLFFYLGWKLRGNKGWHGALVGLVIGFFVYTGAIMTASNNQNAAAEKAAVEEVVDVMEEFYIESRKLNPDGTPALIDKEFNPSQEATGAIGVVQQMIFEMVNQFAEMSNEYGLELQSTGLMDLLNEERLRSDPTLKKSWHIISEARGIVDKYEARSLEIVSEMRDNIQYFEVSEANKREIRAGFDRGFEGSMKARERIWKLERMQYDELQAVIDMLAANPQSWDIEDDQFLFDSDQLIDQFNRHMTNIDNYLAEQVEIQDSQIQKQRKTLEELR